MDININIYGTKDSAEATVAHATTAAGGAAPTMSEDAFATFTAAAFSDAVDAGTANIDPELLVLSNAESLTKNGESYTNAGGAPLL